MKNATIIRPIEVQCRWVMATSRNFVTFLLSFVYLSQHVDDEGDVVVDLVYLVVLLLSDDVGENQINDAFRLGVSHRPELW